MTEARLPLEPYTVVDLTRARAGPTCARVLADWGANVIHVGPPDKPGAKGARVTGSRDGPDFQNLNRNKRSLTIDLSMAEGHELFMKLAATADVITENFRADVKHRLGIDYEAVSKINPGIVYGSISGFGQTGPYKGRPGLDQVAQGMGGLMSITGLPGQGPVRVGIPITDLCACSWPRVFCWRCLIARTPAKASGFIPLCSKPWDSCSIFRPPAICSAAMSPARPAMVIRPGNPKIALRHRISASTSPDNRDALCGEIGEIVKQKPADYWIELLNEAGVPCGPVNRIDELFADPQMQHLHMVHHVEHERLGRLEIVRQPVNLSARPLPETFRLPAPDIGEHTDQILHELGLDDREIAALRTAEVI